jgi:hypothetical protein
MHTPIHTIGQPFMAIGGGHERKAPDVAPAVQNFIAAQTRIADKFKEKRAAVRAEVDALTDRYGAHHAAIIAAAQLQKSIAIEIGTSKLAPHIAHENEVLRELLYVILVNP